MKNNIDISYSIGIQIVNIPLQFKHVLKLKQEFITTTVVHFRLILIYCTALLSNCLTY